MNSLTPKNSQNSSGSSTVSSSNSSVDMPQQRRQRSGEPKQRGSTSRSRSFLHCLGKHLGRHFLHSHHHHDANVYNSQDDIRSSSTDSFSLSFERASRTECQNIVGGGGGGGSSIDLTSNSDEHNSSTSRGSSTSACSRYSPALCPLDADELDAYERYSATNSHIYVQTMYRPTTLRQEDDDDEVDNANDELSSSCDDEDAENNAPNTPTKPQTKERSSSAKGLHLSRISISSSVLGRMFHHFSATASSRSLSCSSTPLHLSVATKSTKSTKSDAEATTKSSAKKSSNTSAATAAASASKKKEKKQQSILRPPVHYVYMKGMSGLYSRVPRYTVCCPYAMQQVS